MDAQPPDAEFVPELSLWLDQIPDAIDMLCEQDPELDLTPGSLSRLESLLLQDIPVNESDIAAYLGETLLRVAGGSWGWQTHNADSGEPVVHPDPVLSQAPIAVMGVIADAINLEFGDTFDQTCRQLQETVDGYRATNPEWQPVKEPTLGVDPSSANSHPVLASWLAEYEAAFPDWLTDTEDEASFDFSPGSLPKLSRLVRERFASRDEFEAAESGAFLQGAAWYLGWVMVRHYGASWSYTDPRERDVTSGEPKVVKQSGQETVPLSDLYGLLLERDKDVLGSLLNYFAGDSG